MGKKFKGIYRIESARKPNWNYGWDGMYYVTICTGGRELYFGDVINGQMIFSDIGQIAHEFWKEIPEHFRFVRLDEFQIMPDHVHGLIEINHKNRIESNDPGSIFENEHKQVKKRDETPKLVVSTATELKENSLCFKKIVKSS